VTTDARQARQRPKPAWWRTDLRRFWSRFKRIRRGYNHTEIRKTPCIRYQWCGNFSHYQWSVCADGNVYRPLCAACDVMLNRVVLMWMGDPDIQAKMTAYQATVEAFISQPEGQ
jgi:hypothetical protein